LRNIKELSRQQPTQRLLHALIDFRGCSIHHLVWLEDPAPEGKIGWLEIDGWVSGEEMEQHAYVGKRLPGRYHASPGDWRLRNYIVHPLQVHRTREEFLQLMDRYYVYMQTES
jgi:hypothetical protein